MSLIRAIINFDDFIEIAFDKREYDDKINIRKGKQNSKGFRFTKENNSISWFYPQNIIINQIEIGTTKKTKFGDLKITIFLLSKIGKKNYIFEDVYVKTLYEKKRLLAPLVLNLSEEFNITIDGLKEEDNVFIDVDFNIIENKPEIPDNKNFNK